MTAINVVVLAVLAALIAFFLVMWVRLVFDWARVLKPNWRPHGLALVLAESSYAITDPPIRVVKHVIPPIRVGGARVEFSWSIVMLGCLAMIWVIGLFA